MTSTITQHVHRHASFIIEPAGTTTLPKMYVNSVCVTGKGTWLVSFTRADKQIPEGPYIPERVFVRRSEDRGATWQNRILVYDGRDSGAQQAEMGQLVAAPHLNRVYQFSVRHSGNRFGKLVFTYSDDDGCTWLGPQGPNSAFDINIPTYALTPKGDGNHLMARGIILENGKYLLPMTIATDPPTLDSIEAEVIFLVSDNLFTERNPSKLRFMFYPRAAHGIRVPLDSNATRSLAQEPHMVQLRDGRLMCTMRTGNGCIYYSVSVDSGQTWTPAQPLRYVPGGERILHPNAPCLLVRLRDGRFLLFHHNNDGKVFGSKNVFDFRKNRRPVYLCVGRELLHGPDQPMIFTPSRFLHDSDGVPAGHMGTTELSCYSGVIEDDRGVFFIYSNKWSQIEALRIPPAILDDTVLY